AEAGVLPLALRAADIPGLEALAVTVLDAVAFLEVAPDALKDGEPGQVQEVAHGPVPGTDGLDRPPDAQQRFQDARLEHLGGDGKAWYRPRRRRGEPRAEPVGERLRGTEMPRRQRRQLDPGREHGERVEVDPGGGQARL